MKSYLIVLIVLISVPAFATSWAPVYPFTQKTEGGTVQCRSVPYGVHDGPYGPGETIVYYKGKRLYSINKYISTLFFTANRGEYLIEFNFRLSYTVPHKIIGEHGEIIAPPIDYQGDAVNIYKNGALLRAILFSDLAIDTSKLWVNKAGNWFWWNYTVADTTKDAFKIKMAKHPVYIEGDTLCLITATNELINVRIFTGQIISRQNALKVLTLKRNWQPTTVKRKINKVKYPDQFMLPKLRNGMTIDNGLAILLKNKVADGERDSALIQLYFHTLLINRDGKCESVYVSSHQRTDVKVDFGTDANLKMKSEVEQWIMQQTFETKTIPKSFFKFKYSDFVYLKP